MMTDDMTQHERRYEKYTGRSRLAETLVNAVNLVRSYTEYYFTTSGSCLADSHSSSEHCHMGGTNDSLRSSGTRSNPSKLVRNLAKKGRRSTACLTFVHCTRAAV